MQKNDFFLCGFTGWCLEILWTGLHSLVTGHFTMMGKTSLLMFPVYGLAALIRPAYYKLARFPVMVRGIIYSCGIEKGNCSGTGKYERTDEAAWRSPG